MLSWPSVAWVSGNVAPDPWAWQPVGDADTEVPTLILCVYQDREAGDDVDGFQVGSYGDFAAWRDFIAAKLEGDHWGSRFPTLMIIPIARESGRLWTASLSRVNWR
jgi:hypothetical protein